MVGRAESLDVAAIAAWVAQFLQTCETEWRGLNDLDRQSGDGDFGANLRSAVKRAERQMASTVPVGASGIFGALANAFMSTGGTSGSLFGIWFQGFQEAAADRNDVDLAILTSGAAAGLETIQRVGGASAGDKTMVDAIAPAVAALSAATRLSGELTVALRAAAQAAHDGAMSTASMVARRGRASYVGDASRGTLDPGAVTVALFFGAALGSAAGLARIGFEGTFSPVDDARVT